jgi:hypothetical protein
MAGLVCSEEQALQAGADLWILPDLDHSEWAQKIDWYLNFQLAKAGQHSKLDQSSELQEVIEKWEFDPPSVEIAKQLPLMVASSDLLPNHSTVIIPLGGEVKLWPKRVFELWQKLDQPTLRVFLPKNVDAKAFASNWPGKNDDLSSALVAEI